MATKCIIHVGMPKCGSSALQTALSNGSEFAGKDGERYSYAAIHPKGRLLSGSNAIRQLALRNASGYVISASSKRMEELGAAHLGGLKKQFAVLASEGVVPILSCEGWGHLHSVFSQQAFLEKMDLDCRVIFYVRPQAAWINSAWWQFGAWQNIPLRPWVERKLDIVRWHGVVDGWRSVPGVSSVEPRVLPANILEDFYSLLNADCPSEVKSNVGLPGSVLRLFQRHRKLRRLPQDAAIEFVIARHLELKKASTPWVLDRPIVSDIVAQCRESNLLLLEHLSPEQKRGMDADPAWWSADHYSNRIVEPAGVLPAVAAEVDDLAAAAIKALFDLDENYRALLAECDRMQGTIKTSQV